MSPFSTVFVEKAGSDLGLRPVPFGIMAILWLGAPAALAADKSIWHYMAVVLSLRGADALLERAGIADTFRAVFLYRRIADLALILWLSKVSPDMSHIISVWAVIQITRLNEAVRQDRALGWDLVL